MRIPFTPHLIRYDADSDSLLEIYGYPELPYRPEIYAVEFSETGYDTIRIPAPRGAFTALIGDFDRDHKTDLLVLCSAGDKIYESLDSTSFPSSIVWSESLPAFYPPIHPPIVADLDQDSFREIVFTGDNSRVFRWECVGDNSYLLKNTFRTRTGYTIVHASVSYDMNKNGKPELLVLNIEGTLDFYEAINNDSFRYISSCSAFTGDRIACMVACAPDMDRDGLPEAIVASKNIPAVLSVVEAVNGDSFAVVWDTALFGPSSMDRIIVTGDVDGDGINEFAISDGDSVRVFRCTGNNRYECICTIYNPEIGNRIGFCDVNRDGRDELIIRQTPYTLIYEYSPIGLAEQQHKALEQVKISPSIVAKGKPVLFDQLPEGARVEILDITGRVVAEPDGLWQTRAISPGAYFVRLKLGSQTLTRKLLIVE